MGIISKGILGPFSGTVGTVIGGTWKGISYIRRRPLPTDREPSLLQMEQRARFTTCYSLFTNHDTTASCKL